MACQRVCQRRDKCRIDRVATEADVQLAGSAAVRLIPNLKMDGDGSGDRGIDDRQVNRERRGVIELAGRRRLRDALSG